MQNKIIFTCFQCSRAVLPYFFAKYSLPKMKATYDGEMEGFLIQHIYCNHLRQTEHIRAKYFFETAKLSHIEENRVKTFTIENYYKNLTLFQHQVWFKKYPSLPSIRLGLEKALEHQADYIVWLEDDAMIYTQEWNDIVKKIPQGKIGYFQSFQNQETGYFVKSYCIVLTREFVLKNYDYFLTDQNWNCRAELVKNGEQIYHRLESILGLLSKDKGIQLDPSCISRIHLGKNREQLIDLLKKFVPEKELEMLELDFPIREEKNK